MFKRTVIAALLLLGSTAVFADPGVFFGVTYNFKGASGIGLSIKVLSTDRQDRGVLGLGVSYLPLLQKFGADVDAGYQFKNGAVTGGWDFINNSPQLGLGYVNTEERKHVVAPVPAPL